MSAQSLIDQGYGGYAGWGDAEADADFAATGGAGKWTGGGGGGDNIFSDYYNKFAPEIDKYVQDLKDFANEDYDFAAKWLENQYKIALGNDDQQRAQFIKSVANELESQIGTIAYDYKTGTYRTERDRDIALARLDQDERVEKQKLDLSAEIEREQQGANLNQRGILAGTREGTPGLASKFVGRLESNIAQRYDALNRFFGRGRENILKTSGDRLADLTTAARRAAQGGQYAYDYGMESAERQRERKLLEADQISKERKDWLTSMAKYMA